MFTPVEIAVTVGVEWMLRYTQIFRDLPATHESSLNDLVRAVNLVHSYIAQYYNSFVITSFPHSLVFETISNHTYAIKYAD